MRTFAILSLMLFAVPPRIVSAVDGHIEIRKHRFSKHTGQKFERLVLEFKREGSQGLPKVRVGADSTAGEVSVQVTDVNLEGAIPEAGINDSYVPKSKVLGPISVAANTTHSGFTLRAFLKSPQAKIDAFWLENPSRLVIDAFPANSPRASGVKTTGRAVASRHGKKKLTNNDFVCFPAQTAVGMKVTFQSKAGKRNSDGIPMALEGGPKGSGDGESVVCYPKSSQVIASILFDTPDESAPTARMKSEMKSDLKAERDETTSESIAVAPIQAPVPRAQAKPAITLGAPANSIHNKSPQSEAFDPPKSLALPSAEAKPAPTATGLPSFGLSLPTLPATNPEPPRNPTASNTKPSLNLPLSLLSLPQSNTTGNPGPPKLSLPPPQQKSQAPALLPPIGK